MKRFIKMIISTVLIGTISISMTACGQGNDTSDEFRVALECGYPPFNWTQNDDSNGAVQIKDSREYAGGYDIEIAKKIADGLGKKLVIVKTKWEGLVPGVKSDTFDAIIAGMSPTETRKEEIDFTDAYYQSELIMVVKKGSKYENAKSLADFSRAKITAQLSTFHYTVIDQIKDVDKQTAMDTFPAMRVALESGIIDGYVGERPEGISVTSANPDLTYVEFEEGKGFLTTEEDTSVAVGLKKGSDELREQINTILAGISKEDRTQIMDDAIKNQPANEE